MVIKKLNLTYKKLIIFALVCGIYTGIVAMVPFLKDTSFRDISISFEWWILFGIFIILNSKSNKDAALKCFLFFLISQPLVYLVQILFGGADFAIFNNYKPWFIWTILTLPMGYVGYYMKKDNIYGLLILIPILILLGYHIYIFLREVIGFFPNHLLSLIFCVITMFLYVFCIFSKKRERIIGTLLCILIFALCLIFNFVSGSSTYNTTLKFSDNELYFDNTYKVYMDDDYGKVYIDQVDLGDGPVYCIQGEFNGTGKTKLYLEGNGNKYVFDLDIGRNTYSLDEISN